MTLPWYEVGFSIPQEYVKQRSVTLRFSFTARQGDLEQLVAPGRILVTRGRIKPTIKGILVGAVQRTGVPYPTRFVVQDAYFTETGDYEEGKQYTVFVTPKEIKVFEVGIPQVGPWPWPPKSQLVDETGRQSDFESALKLYDGTNRYPEAVLEKSRADSLRNAIMSELYAKSLEVLANNVITATIANRWASTPDRAKLATESLEQARQTRRLYEEAMRSWLTC